jgi:hypothetical protein
MSPGEEREPTMSPSNDLDLNLEKAGVRKVLSRCYGELTGNLRFCARTTDASLDSLWRTSPQPIMDALHEYRTAEVGEGFRRAERLAPKGGYDNGATHEAELKVFADEPSGDGSMTQVLAQAAQCILATAITVGVADEGDTRMRDNALNNFRRAHRRNFGEGADRDHP